MRRRWVSFDIVDGVDGVAQAQPAPSSEGRPRPDALRRTVSGAVERAERMVRVAEAHTASSLSGGDPTPPEVSAPGFVRPFPRPRPTLDEVASVGGGVRSSSSGFGLDGRANADTALAPVALREVAHRRATDKGALLLPAKDARLRTRTLATTIFAMGIMRRENSDSSPEAIRRAASMRLPIADASSFADKRV
jgi:hypothetical protein